MDQCQPKADRNGSKSLRSTLVGCTHDDDEKERSQQNLGHKAGEQRIPSGRMASNPFAGKPVLRSNPELPLATM